jgi:membrane protease YdiL (CAAX protease family)
MGPDRERTRPAPPPPPTWSPVEAVPVFVISLIAAVVLSLPATLLSCGGMFTMVALVGELALAATVLGWVRYVNRGPLAALGIPRSPLRDLASGIVAGGTLVVVAGIAVGLVQILANHVAGHHVAQPKQVDVCVRGGWLLALGPIFILAAPFAEELFFRGFLYRGLRRRFSLWPAALISGAIFGLAHYQAPSYLLLIPGLAVVGVGLALLFEWRQSVLATMAAHATFNLVGYLFIAVPRR